MPKIRGFGYVLMYSEAMGIDLRPRENIKIIYPKISKFEPYPMDRKWIRLRLGVKLIANIKRDTTMIGTCCMIASFSFMNPYPTK